VKISFSICIGISLILVGCGTTATKVQKVEAAIVPTEKIVKIPVVSMEVGQAPQGFCPKMNADLSKKKLKELVQMGNSCIRSEDWARLEEIGFATNKKEPFQPWGSFFLSMAAEARGDLAKAKWMVELGLKKNPSYGILYYQKGRLYWLDKAYADSLQLVRKAVEMDPGLTEGHLFLGQIYFRDQEFDKASEHFYTVLKSKPSHLVALSGLAESRRYRGDIAGSMEVLNRAIGYHPQAVELQWRQAQIYESNLNDKVNALNSYIQLKRKLIRTPSKHISLVEVETKIRQLESDQRRPAVSAAKNDKGATP
jgi:tetratricopeptide (TPR) repeat protein